MWILVTYWAVFFGIFIWDAFLGLGIDFNGRENPPLALVAFFWPCAIPITMLILFFKYLGGMKEKRLMKERVRRKERIRIEREQELILANIESELFEKRSAR